jgi:uncharacterized protein (DUF885 family)
MQTASSGEKMKRFHKRAIACVAAVVLLPAFLSAQGPAGDDAARFRKLLADDWKYLMTEYPEFATQVGYPGQNHRWTDFSPQAIERRKRRPHESLRALRSIDRAKLPAAERLNYDLYARMMRAAIESQRFDLDLEAAWNAYAQCVCMPLNQMEGVQLRVPDIIAQMPAATVRDYRDILARLRAVPALVDQSIALMKQGLEKGMTPPRITLRDVPNQVRTAITAEPLQSPALEPFTKFPESMPASERARLIAEAIEAYRTAFAPAWEKLHAFLVETYIPAARDSIAFTELPQGRESYAWYVRQHTTTNLTPQEIHETGLREVKRIRAEMEEVIRSTGFRGSFDEFSHFVRTAPRFFFDDAASLVTAYRDIAKRIDEQLPRQFGRLPRLPYGVRPIPDYAAPTQTTAFYQLGSAAAGRAGIYYVNTYNLKARPKWEMEALSLHEAVPGHHLQLSLAQELEGLPDFRKHTGVTAFVEGWALYAESLGTDMGFYTDPYSKYGQLSYQMWRAVRLVVDTGMHTMGWSRQQAIDYFKANSGKTEHDITVEIDRYIVWPGQALAYKIGELKIRELRAYAEKELGEQFSVRAFHDQVLGQGALPMDVLEARVRTWVAGQKREVRK